MKEQRRRIRRKNIGYKKFLLLLIMVFIVIFLLFKVVPSTARYVYGVVKSFYLSTKEFYFNSNRLSESGDHFTAENWDGVDSYPIEVEMNSINNKNVKAPMNITYQVKMSYELYHANGNKYDDEETKNLVVVQYINGDLTDTTDEDGNAVKQGVIYAGGSYTNTDTFSISISKKSPTVSLEDDDYVIVYLEANSISPYKKKITGDFKVTVGNLGLSYKIEDNKNDPYLKAIVTNTLSESKTVTLSFDPDEVVFDNTLEYATSTTVTGNGYASENLNDTTNTYVFTNQITFTIGAEESKTIRFYKKDSTENYTYPDGTSNPPVVVFSFT